MASDLTHEKQQLHELVDRLAPSQVHAVRGLLQVIAALGTIQSRTFCR